MGKVLSIDKMHPIKREQKGRKCGVYNELGLQDGLIAKSNRRLWLCLVDYMVIGKEAEVRGASKDGGV